MAYVVLQNAPIGLPIGVFVDATDGFTPEEALTLAAGRADLYKNVASPSRIDISARTWTHINKGVYALTLLAGDVDTAGSATLVFTISGARPLVFPLFVLGNTILSGVLNATQFPADTSKINGSATAAANLGASGLGIVSFTVSTSSTTTVVTSNLTASVNGFYVGRTLVFTSGALAGQAATITAYNGTTKALTVTALTSAPASNDTAVIV